jgi:Zn/Cd-binding protein ZinT
MGHRPYVEINHGSVSFPRIFNKWSETPKACIVDQIMNLYPSGFGALVETINIRGNAQVHFITMNLNLVGRHQFIAELMK